MKFPFKKFTSIECTIEIGDTVYTDFNGKEWRKPRKVQDACFSPGSGSGVSVKLEGIDNYIDSDWCYLEPTQYFNKM